MRMMLLLRFKVDDSNVEEDKIEDDNDKKEDVVINKFNFFLKIKEEIVTIDDVI